jgi:hypothetical protein
VNLMKRVAAAIGCLAGMLVVVAVQSGKIAEHLGTSQRNVLALVFCGYFVLLVGLVVFAKRRRHRC